MPVAGLLLLLSLGCSQSYQPKSSTEDMHSYFDSSYEQVTINYTAKLISVTQEPQVSAAMQGPFSTTSGGFLHASLNGQSSWALEVPGVMGFFSNGSVLAPMVTSATCPSLKAAQTFQFLSFNPSIIGYGSVDVVSAGDLVNFTKINQYQFPGAPTPPGTPVTNPGPGAITGYCGSSAYGTLVGITQTIQFNGAPENAVDTINIADGFLFEEGGGNPFLNNSVPADVLGGVGSVGLVRPSAALDAGSFVSASYTGFDSNGGPVGFTGASAGSSACAALQSSLKTLSPPPSANTLYGGDFPNSDPSSNQTPNCDIAIDLGTQDPKDNGLFTSATVYFGTAYSGNTTNALVVAPAVAIAGPIQSQNAIFVETNYAPTGTTPLSLYLLQAAQ
jgi:hypothetical protein